MSLNLFKAVESVPKKIISASPRLCVLKISEADHALDGLVGIGGGVIVGAAVEEK